MSLNNHQDPAKHAIRAKIAHALAEAKEYRKNSDVGCAIGMCSMYGIADLAPFAPLDPAWGLPTLATGREFPELDRARDNETMGKRIRAASGRLFAGFDFVANGLCMAGGAVSARLMHGAKHAGDYCDDFDLFLVGHDEKTALAAIKACATHLEKSWPKMVVFRTPNCITFTKGSGKCRPVQIILRLFGSRAEVIHSFDLGSSAFLWDGAALWTTALGKIAAEHAVNVLDLSARRSSYERRLARYFNRGFGVVLPHLDVEALFEMKGRLPFIHVGLTVYNQEAHRHVRVRIENNTVCVRAFYANIGGADSISAYQPFTVPYNSTGQIDVRNVAALAAEEVNSGALCAWAPWSALSGGVANLQPKFDPATIEAWVRAVFRGANPNINTLKMYVGTEAAQKLMAQFIEDGKLRAKTLTTVCIERAAHFNAAAKFPFKFAAASGVLGPWPLRTCSVGEWYGAALFGSLYTAPPRPVPQIVPAPVSDEIPVPAPIRDTDSVESSSEVVLMPTKAGGCPCGHYHSSSDSDD
jgi:hypothetical protein